MSKDLDLRRLRFFVEVVRQGGFSPAAKVLFATQSTVSKAVGQLQKELGIELMQRVGNRSELTDAGRLVYEQGLMLLAASARLSGQIGELKGVRIGELKLGFPHLGTSSLFASEIAEFKRRHPAVRVDIVVHNNATLLDHLRSGTLEVVATASRVPPELHALQVRKDVMVVLLPSAHPLARSPQLALRELADERFLLFDAGSPLADLVLRECAKARFTPQVAAHTGQLDLVVQLVAAGVGVALVPRPLSDLHRHPLVHVVPLRPSFTVQLSLAWRRGGYLSHAARAWLEIAGAHAPESPPSVIEKVPGTFNSLTA
jgi:DNA-binding transcriptional LysR family regulator